MTRFTSISAIALLCSASSVSAFDWTAGLAYQSNGMNGTRSDSIQSTIAAEQRFDPLVVQGDLGFGQAAIGQGTSINAGLHLSYALSDSDAQRNSIGLFGGWAGDAQNFNDAAMYYGVEGRHAYNEIDVEWFLGQQDDNANQTSANYGMLTAKYSLSSMMTWSGDFYIVARLGDRDFSAEQDEYMAAGIGWDLGGGIVLEATYGEESQNEIFGVSVSYNFQEGTSFGRRDIAGVFGR